MSYQVTYFPDISQRPMHFWIKTSYDVLTKSWFKRSSSILYRVKCLTGMNYLTLLNYFRLQVAKIQYQLCFKQARLRAFAVPSQIRINRDQCKWLASSPCKISTCALAMGRASHLQLWAVTFRKFLRLFELFELLLSALFRSFSFHKRMPLSIVPGAKSRIDASLGLPIHPFRVIPLATNLKRAKKHQNVRCKIV